MKNFIEKSELILNPDGSIYHLNLSSHQMADRIFFVGDPDRVAHVGKHFDKIEHTVKKREFYTLTGYIGKQRLSVISTGIGTDNIDIVWNELDALFNIDLQERTPRPNFKAIRVLRLGTCGGLSPDLPPGSMVHSQYAIGADGLMHFYDTNASAHNPFQKALSEFQHKSLTDSPAFYSSACSPGLHKLISSGYPQIHKGITLTAAGFYGPQGRSLGRLKLRYPEFIEIISSFSYEKLSVLNLEMETAGILGLGSSLGHHAGSLSVILANRTKKTFTQNPQKEVEKLIKTGIEIMLSWD